jgi:hypothetical protein
MEAEQAAVQEKKLRDWKMQMLQMKEMRLVVASARGDQ